MNETTIELLQSENAMLRAGYDAARLEIESLQDRLINVNEQHRKWFAHSQDLELQLKSALTVMEYNAQIGAEWAARAKELDRKLEKEINARQQAQIENEQLKERIARGDIKHEKMRLEAKVAELQAMLDAVGAGGVEPLRRRQCLHQIAEPKQCTSCA